MSGGWMNVLELRFGRRYHKPTERHEPQTFVMHGTHGFASSSIPCDSYAGCSCGIYYRL